ncbi:MAG: TolC family outer membrane protein [Gammaproteobacteria bacterium]|nr:TolC family outer membrane protein [Gammaproteobacteria bacterium]
MLACAAPASAADLLSLYRQALVSDPAYQEALYSESATREARPQAQARLLPEIEFRTDGSFRRQDITAPPGPFGGRMQTDFKEYGYRLQVRQPLFRPERILQLAQSKHRIQEASAQARGALQGLLLRVSEAYFGILGARKNLLFVRAEIRSLEEQLRRARQRLELGLGTIVDVEEVQAGFDLAVARELRAQNDLAIARERLREITGAPPPKLEELREDLPLTPPQPENVATWVKIAGENDPAIHAAQQRLERLQREIGRQRAGHLPTVDLVAHNNSRNTGGRFGNSIVDEDMVRLEMQLPLFQGGTTNSQTRQAREEHKGARASLERVQRTAERGVRESFWSVQSEISRVRALAQAVNSNRTALQAAQAGLEVGTRTSVDLVNAERSLSEAQSNHARARYDYVLNTLRLKRAAGILQDSDLEELNRWLAPEETDKINVETDAAAEAAEEAPPGEPETPQDEAQPEEATGEDDDA